MHSHYLFQVCLQIIMYHTRIIPYTQSLQQSLVYSRGWRHTHEGQWIACIWLRQLPADFSVWWMGFFGSSSLFCSHNVNSKNNNYPDMLKRSAVLSLVYIIIIISEPPTVPKSIAVILQFFLPELEGSHLTPKTIALTRPWQWQPSKLDWGRV